MSLDHDREQISPAVGGRRLLWLTYVFVAVTLLCWFGGKFLAYLWPEASDWLIPIGAICTMIAMVWLIACAFLPKPRSAPILLATLVIIQTTSLLEARSVGGIMGLGFRIHASPVEQYLTKCRMFEFTENGAKRTFGDCESRAYEEGFPAGLGFFIVIYDPSGNLAKRESEWSPEWRQAFDKVKVNDVGIMKFHGASRLFGDFYLVDLSY